MKIHFARLAVVILPDGTRDRRGPWPPRASATARRVQRLHGVRHAGVPCVRAMTIRQVKEDGGGTVCLAVGPHHVDQVGIVLDGTSSSRIRGQGLRPVVVPRGLAFVVADSRSVTLGDVTVVGSGGSPGIELRSTVAATVERLSTLALVSADLPGRAIVLAGTHDEPPVPRADRQALADAVLGAPVAGGRGR